MFKEVDGNLITMALNGDFDVIAHGVNCQCVQGAGLAPQMVKVFGTDSFPMEDPNTKGEIWKLGNIEYQTFHQEKEEYGNGWVRYPDENVFLSGKFIYVVNAYTQYNYGRNHSDGDSVPVDYEAITLCMRKMNKVFAGKHIGLPKIGCGLAGGDWNIVKAIIQKELKDCNVTIVNYKK